MTAPVKLKNKLNPLAWNIPIVDPQTGLPTQEFMRKWEQQKSTNGTIPDLTTAANVSAVMDEFGTTLHSVLMRGASIWGIVTPSAVLDTIGAVRGDVLFRGASAWQALAPGTNGQALTTAGSGADPSWTTINSLPSIADGDLLSNQSGSSGVPSAHTLTSLIDYAIGSTQGDILYRNASGWVVLAPGTSGNFLQTQGSAANPVWAAAGLPSIANLDLLANISGGTAAPSATTFTAYIDAALGNVAGGVIVRFPSNWGELNPGTSGQFLQTQGVGGGAPQWASITGLMPSIADGDLMANTSGGSAVPVATTLSHLIDYDMGGTQGDVLYRNGSGWVVLAPGTSGQFLKTLGSAANPAWGTVNQLPSITDADLLANTSGGAALPIATTLTGLIDYAIGSTQGDILYRDSALWKVLAPGTAGQVLQSGGAAANPSWLTSAGLTAIADGDLLSNQSGGSAVPVAHTLTSLIDYALGSTQGDILYRNATAWVVLGPGSSGQFLKTNGAAANPSWGSPSSGGFTAGSQPTIVQSASNESNSQTANTVTFGSTPTIGNVLVFICFANAYFIPYNTKLSLETHSRGETEAGGNSLTEPRIYVYTRNVVSGDGTTWTFGNQDGDWSSVYAMEIAGSAGFTVKESHGEQSSRSATGVVSGPMAQTIVGNGLAFCAVGDSANITGATVNTGWSVQGTIGGTHTNQGNIGVIAKYGSALARQSPQQCFFTSVANMTTDKHPLVTIIFEPALS